MAAWAATAGVACAAVLLTVLLEYLRTVANYEFLPVFVREIAKNRMIIFSLVLIALMLTRPQGLFGGIRAFGAGPSRKVPGGGLIFVCPRCSISNAAPCASAA